MKIFQAIAVTPRRGMVGAANAKHLLATEQVPVQQMVDDWTRRGGTPTTPQTLRAEKAKAELAAAGIDFDSLKINLSTLPRRR